MTIDTLDSLLEEQLKDLYDAEKQLTKALPKMARAAKDAELKAAFTDHLGTDQRASRPLGTGLRSAGKEGKIKALRSHERSGGRRPGNY